MTVRSPPAHRDVAREPEPRENLPVSAVVQPSGTVSLVFTDIEGSTRLLERLGVDAYREALSEHRRIVREACARHEGYEVDAEGDAFFYAFASAQAAVDAVSKAMVGLEGGPIRIRVGIHTGEPGLDGPNYIGMDVHRAARIMSAAHGGQVVLSPSTVALLQPGSVALRELGQHRLKDLSSPIALHQLLIAGQAEEFPPLKTLHRSNLPVPATPFLGREVELAAVTERLLDPDTRLMTLTGPGGTGKTRLALRAAAEAAEQYPDGITWVPLSPVREPTLVVPTIARALDIDEQSGEPLEDTLVSALRGKKHLLLLDNLEHLLPEAADALAALLAGCPTVGALLTSRERLQIQIETVWPVPPLTEADGETLFVERALAAGVELEADRTVAELCRRLDDLPLAIQLAAARTRSLSPARILEGLSAQSDILATRARDVDERQRTLEATIEWSYELLEPGEQRVLRALSVFAGGCTLEAASAVAGAGIHDVEDLLDKSLLRHQTDGLGRDRYWMLETIRDFAGRRLENAGESDDVFEAFLDWLEGMVGAVDEWWLTRDQLHWFRTLESERPNLMHGIVRSRARGEHSRALRLLVGAYEFIDAWGPYAPLADLLENRTSTTPEIDGRAQLLYLMLLLRLGRLQDATTQADASMRLFAGDQVLLGRLLGFRSFIVLQLGDPQRAVALATEALDLARPIEDHRGIASALNSLGLAEMTLGEFDGADAHLRESEAISRQYGDIRNACIAGGNAALVLLAARKPDEATRLLQAITAAVSSLEGPTMVAMQLGNLAIGLAATRDTSGARTALRQAIELDAAQFEQALAVEGLLVLAIAAVHDRALDLAALLWGTATAALVRFDYVLGPELTVYVTDVLEPLRARPEFEARWERGRVLPVDEALALGLEEPERDKATT